MALAGCGDSDDSDARTTTYPASVPRASFPARQSLAEHVELRLAVRNAGTRTIPNIAATISAGGPDSDGVTAFGSRLDQEGLASTSRPVWVVDDGPVNGDSAYSNTWSLGPIAPHDTKVFTWSVVPVRAGRYTLRYRLSASTTGTAVLETSRGGAPHGTLSAHVTGKPAEVRVTSDGEIVSAPPQ